MYRNRVNKTCTWFVLRAFLASINVYKLLLSYCSYAQHVGSADPYMYRNGFDQTCIWRELCRVEIGILASTFRVLKYFLFYRYFHVSKCHHFTQPSNVFIGLVTSQRDMYHSAKSPLTCQCGLLRKSSPSVEGVGAFTHYARKGHPFLKSWVRSQFAAIPARVTNNGKPSISRVFWRKK